jgi:hypothetical protein
MIRKTEGCCNIGQPTIGVTFEHHIEFALAAAEVEMRYRILHMCFRLMAAVIGLPVTPMSEIIELCPGMLLYLTNVGTLRKLGYITFEL